ncbi:MAG: hypothetical protein MRERV_20c040 [Mycoplasmataceae bacterium RV_VA103A]|nr:MAG: hypothetical protein MRERV_20c040 [Mycoplasmataceae bacterium RV_VA103A]
MNNYHLISNKSGKYKKLLGIEIVETFEQFKLYVLDSRSKDFLAEDKKLTYLCSFVAKYFSELSLNDDYQSGRRHLQELFGKMKSDLQLYQSAFWELIEKYLNLT